MRTRLSFAECGLSQACVCVCRAQARYRENICSLRLPTTLLVLVGVLTGTLVCVEGTREGGQKGCPQATPEWQATQARVREGVPPSCPPGDGWVPDTISQKCYKLFGAEDADFFRCSEICGSALHNASIVMPRTRSVLSFVKQKVLTEGIKERYWVGLYRMPEQRKQWVWMSYAPFDQMILDVPAADTGLWPLSEWVGGDVEGTREGGDYWQEANCALVDLGRFQDDRCSGTQVWYFPDGTYFPETQHPLCICRYPDRPHPRFELDMELTKSYRPPEPLPIIQIALVIDYTFYAVLGLQGLMVCCTVWYRCSLFRAGARDQREIFYRALLMFPLCLDITMFSESHAKVAQDDSEEQPESNQGGENQVIRAVASHS